MFKTSLFLQCKSEIGNLANDFLFFRKLLVRNILGIQMTHTLIKTERVICHTVEPFFTIGVHLKKKHVFFSFKKVSKKQENI